MDPGLSLVFASNNTHKLKEIKSMLVSSFSLVTLKEIGCVEELAETSTTLTGNARQKARYVFDKYGMACFADDSGLEVDALQGMPGVYSARYAGPNASYEDNVDKLLIAMKGIENRSARFKTVIALITDHESKLFEGVIEGTIAETPRGLNGFGYDPVFVPKDSELTFAEMTEADKNKISHRKIALRKLVEYLEEVKSEKLKTNN